MVESLLKNKKQIIKDAALKKYGYDYESSLSNETLIKRNSS